jgi:hypothetical protein
MGLRLISSPIPTNGPTIPSSVHSEGGLLNPESSAIRTPISSARSTPQSEDPQPSNNRNKPSIELLSTTAVIEIEDSFNSEVLVSAVTLPIFNRDLSRLGARLAHLVEQLSVWGLIAGLLLAGWYCGWIGMRTWVAIGILVAVAVVVWRVFEWAKRVDAEIQAIRVV